jgi:zinc finger FYVE domain-containing protein 26
MHFLTKAQRHLEQYFEIHSTVKQQTGLPLGGGGGGGGGGGIDAVSQQQWKQKPEQQNLCKQMSIQEVTNYLNAINLQIEVTKFINNCYQDQKKEEILSKKTPTLFGSNDTKINLCCLILLSGQSIQEGFGFVIRIIQCFNLNSTLVYSQIASELAKQYNFKEINNLLKCINESGYREEVNSSYDECISTCIRVFAASNQSQIDTTTTTTTSSSGGAAATNTSYSQQYNKEIEELIHLIKDDENKINAYILNGRLKSAYLIAIKIDRADIVKHIGNVAERLGQSSIRDICSKWIEKKSSFMKS